MTEQQAAERPGRFGRAQSIAPPPSILWALAIAVVGLIVYVSRDFVLLLLLSATVAYLINPIVKIAESALFKRSIAVTVIYLGIGLSLLATAYFLFPRLRTEVDALSNNLPFFGDRLDEAIDTLQSEIVSRYPAAERFFTSREVRNVKLNQFIEQQATNFPGLVSHLVSMVLAGVLVPLFSYFFLRDSRKIVHFVLDRLPASHIETSVAVWCEVDRIVGRYLRGLAIEGMVITVIAGSGLWMLGINYPLLLGVLSGVANVVPYLGPIVGGTAALLVTLVQFKSITPVVQVFILYLSLKLLDITVVQPMALGGEKELHPVLLIASIIVGGHVLGIVGMVIAVPTVTILQKIARLLLERRGYSAHTAENRLRGHVQTQPYVC